MLGVAWEFAHIPTTHTLWVFKRDACHVEEMLSFSPHGDAPTVSQALRFPANIDRLEDWT